MQYDGLGKFIRNKRVSIGISLNKFSINNEIEPAVLSRIENDKQDIKMRTLIKIANGFNTTPAKLLSEFENSN